MATTKPESSSLAPIKVDAKVIQGPKSGKFTRDLAFHMWALSGGPATEIAEVARAFGVPPSRVYAWKERDGWDVKWQARMSEAEEALRGRSSFRVSQYVSQEQLDRSFISLYVAMTAVISSGGLNPRKKDGTDRPVVSFRVADYITVLDRLGHMLHREEDRKRLGGVLGEMPLGVTKEDLSILASLPPDKVKSLSLLADGFLEFLREKELIRPDAPTEGPGGTGAGASSRVTDPSKDPENQPLTSPVNSPEGSSEDRAAIDADSGSEFEPKDDDDGEEDTESEDEEGGSDRGD